MSKKEIKKEHYVNNKEFFVAMVEWKVLVNQANEQDDVRPPISEYIGDCFVKIAEHLSYRPNFVNYPFREEMIGDGIENCLMYAHNFNPEKSKNPFSYFTQIIYYAFLRRIEKEKKQNYIKYKLLENADDDQIRSFCKENYFETSKLKKSEPEHNKEEKQATEQLKEHFRLNEHDIEKFTPKRKKRKVSKKKAKSKTNLDSILQDEQSEDMSNKR
jgi:hypothetical protein